MSDVISTTDHQETKSFWWRVTAWRAPRVLQHKGADAVRKFVEGAKRDKCDRAIHGTDMAECLLRLYGARHADRDKCKLVVVACYASSFNASRRALVTRVLREKVTPFHAALIEDLQSAGFHIQGKDLRHLRAHVLHETHRRPDLQKGQEKWDLGTGAQKRLAPNRISLPWQKP